VSISALSGHPDRRQSSSSHRDDPSPHETSPVPLGEIGRTSSYYSHQRDTEFDEYVAARQSLSLKTDIERAMGAEFGWVASPASTTEDLARRSSVVNSGTVPSAKAQSAVENMGRVPSSGSFGARALTAVPEMVEEDGYDEAGDGGDEGRKSGGGEEDREALLKGHERSTSDEGVTTTDLEEVDLGQKKRKWTNS
jgi:hypothetical protein